jgi:multidrug efflux pump subunit AcrA (membrane-fusion protein)
VSDPVKAEVDAVRALAIAVSRHAEHLGNVAASARSAARAADARVQRALEERRQRLDSAAAALRHAEDALSRCDGNCGGLVQAVKRSQRQFEDAAHEYQQAQRAARIMATATAELLRSIHAAEAVVGQQASISSAALAELEGRLKEIAGPGHASWWQSAIFGIGATLAGISGAGHVAKSLDPFIIPPGNDVTIAQRRDEYLAEQAELWAEQEKKKYEG